MPTLQEPEENGGSTTINGDVPDDIPDEFAGKCLSSTHRDDR